MREPPPFDPARHVIVPHRPGPLISSTDDAPRRTRDELDQLIDDLLPDVNVRPGQFDVGLAVVGLGLVVWALAAGGPTWALVIGLVSLALGAVVPIRAMGRWIESRSRRRRLGQVLEQGLALDVTSAQVAQLTETYTRALEVADALPDRHLGDQIKGLAHRALVEVATSLDGAAPAGPGQGAQVAARTESIAAMIETFRPDRADPAGPPRGHDDLVAAARAELDELDPSSSVTGIRDLIDEQEGRRGL